MVSLYRGIRSFAPGAGAEGRFPGVDAVQAKTSRPPSPLVRRALAASTWRLGLYDPPIRAIGQVAVHLPQS